jgi:antitoxin component HigA of HigAB toxin-antitoxin module
MTGNEVKPKALESDEEYFQALQKVSKYFDETAALDSSAGDEFKELLVVIESYEQKHYVI